MHPLTTPYTPSQVDAFLKGKLAELELTPLVALPEEGMLYDYSIRLDDFSGRWVGWMETVPAFELSPKTEFALQPLTTPYNPLNPLTRCLPSSSPPRRSSPYTPYNPLQPLESP